MKEFRSKLFGEHDPYKDFHPMPPDMQGWASDRPVFREVLTELKPKFIVEVGTWKGMSAFHMADLLLEMGHRDFEIICVDTWLGSVEHWTQMYGPIHPILRNGRPQLYEQFLSNVMHRGYQDWITPLPIDSLNAAHILMTMEFKPDLIYIDAGHEYYSVKHDLYMYSQVLRTGGYIIGDDFFHEPVKLAAFDTFGEDKVIPKGDDKFVWIK